MVHPDDEVFIAAWIRRLTSAGRHVSLAWTHQTPVRREEARAAAQLLGVPDDRLRFLDGEDGRIAEQMPQLFPQIEEAVRAVAPDRVVTPAFEQGHLDHDATNLMVNRAFAGPVVEVPLYHAYVTRLMTLAEFADRSTEERIELAPDEARLKRQLLDVYRSQSIGTIFRIVDALQRLGRGPRLFRYESARIQSHRDFGSPNLPSPLRERVERSPRWRRWRKAQQAFEARHGAGTLEGRAGMAEW